MRNTKSTRPHAFGLVTNLAITLLILFAFVSVVSVVAGLGEIGLQLGHGGETARSHAEANVELAARAALADLQAGAFLASVVAVATWAYKAHAGARAIGATGMRFSPLAAVAWYLAPFANLWMPYRVMAEAWRASSDPHAAWAAHAPLLVKAWWASLLGSVAAGTAAQFLLTGPEGLSSRLWVSTLVLASDAFGAAAAVLLVLVVNEVSNRQDAWHEALRVSRRVPPLTTVAAG